MKVADLHWSDFIGNPQKLVELIIPGKKTLVWHSNAWDSNAAFFRFTQQELERNHMSLGGVLKIRLRLNLWRHKYSKTLLLGRDLNDIDVVLTDGGVDLAGLNPSNYLEV